jgi:DNA-binding transcriptional MocR family regulator
MQVVAVQHALPSPIDSHRHCRPNPALSVLKEPSRVPRPEQSEAFPGDPEPSHPGVIDLSLNRPPLQPAAAALRRALRALQSMRADAALLDYASDAQLARYSDAVSRWLAEACGQADVDPRAIIGCSGARAGLALCLEALLPDGGEVLCDALTYSGFKALAHARRIRLVAVELDDEGCRPDALAAAAERSGARVWLACPTLQNPLGVTASHARRRALADVAERLDLQVIEDDVYAALLPPSLRAPTLAQLLPQRCWQVGSASKAIAPALGAGWVRAPTARAEALRARSYAGGQLVGSWNTQVFIGLVESGEAQRVAEGMRAELSSRHALARDIFGPGNLPSNAGPAPHLWLPTTAGQAEVLHARMLDQGVRLTAADVPPLASIPATGLRICLGAADGVPQLGRALRALAATIAVDAGSSDPGSSEA